ncbi:hypothetical protein D3C73_1154020 [compost metagenome]
MADIISHVNSHAKVGKRVVVITDTKLEDLHPRISMTVATIPPKDASTLYQYLWSLNLDPDTVVFINVPLKPTSKDFDMLAHIERYHKCKIRVSIELEDSSLIRDHRLVSRRGSLNGLMWVTNSLADKKRRIEVLVSLGVLGKSLSERIDDINSDLYPVIPWKELHGKRKDREE